MQGGALPQPLPLLPADNWWNTDISSAPVDSNSASFISFINNGGTRRLHPDFGGDVATGSVDIYGLPYATVDGSQPKLTVQFQYSDESDGVDHSTDTSFAFYPIPTQAITQAHWVEGGAPGNVDQRNDGDRHLLILDRDNRLLYELYNVWYDGSVWRAGSGALFDLKTNNRRPEGWTSADAAGLAILPGLVRYDEVFNAYGTTVSGINHAFRVTVRSSNGHVYPGSHSAGSQSGALPMGARLRLKASKNISGFTPEMQKIFRAMKTYGLIVADNGSDMYISGTYDTNWNNDVLNPAFDALSASDFEVLQLGWKPPATAVGVSQIAIAPASLVGGNGASGSVTLSGAAPTGGITVALTASGPITVPASVNVAAGATSNTFAIATQGVAASTSASATASYSGTSKSASLTLTAAQLTALNVNPGTLTAGGSGTGSVVLNGQAPPTGAVLLLASSNKGAATVPDSVTIAAGAGSAAFDIVARPVRRTQSTTISAAYGGITYTFKLTVRKASLFPPPNPY
ncbi:MAG: hypothetical protein ABIQ97_03675 [Lysobacteraceae bacterium]